MVDPQIHFGLGENSVIDSLYVSWPDGKEQLLDKIKCDQILTLSYHSASTRKKPLMPAQSKKLFASQSGKTKIEYRHAERQFIDFDIQPLLPHLYSQEGPGIAVGDVNSDGLDDFFIGGSTGYSGMIFTQQSSGTFKSFQPSLATITTRIWEPCSSMQTVMEIMICM